MSGRRGRWVYREDRELLGEMLQRARLDRNFSQDGLAYQLGKSHSFISRVEAGRQTLELVMLFDLLRAMKIEPVEFVAAFEKRVRDLGVGG